MELRQDFAAKSTDKVMDGCVGAVDGYLLSIVAPSSTEAPNVRSYFSGHYQQYGLNVLAMCDAHCRFRFVAVVAPGSSSDSLAYRRTKLVEWIEKLPNGCFVAGDNAYICSEHLLTPFCGSNRCFPENDNYNFFLSQVSPFSATKVCQNALWCYLKSSTIPK